MADVVMEVERRGRWCRIGAIRADEQPGSISSEEQQGRQVYLFGWWEGQPGVWRSIGGIDVEAGDLRMVTMLGLDRVADLTRGPFEMPVWHPSRSFNVRFRLADG